MAGFTKQFEVVGPIGSDQANEIDTFIKDDTKKTIAERYALEHQELNVGAANSANPTDPNAQGRHVPGLVSVLFVGTTTELEAFVTAQALVNGIGTGAIALNTTTGNLMYYNGSVFSTLGLTAVVYSAGNGLTLTTNTFAIDAADVDDMTLGTGAAKVVTPGMGKWCYGLTEYMEMSYKLTGTIPDLISADTYEDLPLNTLDEDGIIDASLDFVTGIFTLPVGVYEIEIFTGSTLYFASSTYTFTQLYNVTTSSVELISLPTGSSGNYITSLSPLYGTISLTEETELKIQVYSNTAVRLGNKYIYTGLPTIEFPHAVARIWKKKASVA